MPEGFEISIRRLSIEADEGDDWELMFHKTLYRETNHKACMITQSPLASAEAMAVLAERYGTEVIVRPESVGIDYSDRLDHPVVKPIDAEAVYPNPPVGLCRWDAPTFKAAYSYGAARNTIDRGSIAFGSWNGNQLQPTCYGWLRQPPRAAELRR